MSDVFEHAKKNHLDSARIQTNCSRSWTMKGKNNRKGDIMREKNESNETLQPGNFEI